jgi:hypothetical protein
MSGSGDAGATSLALLMLGISSLLFVVTGRLRRQESRR